MWVFRENKKSLGKFNNKIKKLLDMQNLKEHNNFKLRKGGSETIDYRYYGWKVGVFARTHIPIVSV